MKNSKENTNKRIWITFTDKYLVDIDDESEYEKVKKMDEEQLSLFLEKKCRTGNAILHNPKIYLEDIN